MNSVQDKINKIYNLIVSLNENDIVCNVVLASVLQDYTEYKFTPLNNMYMTRPLEKGDTYPCGVVGDVNIHVDPFLKYGDTRVFNKQGELLIDLKEHGFNDWIDFI
jgi:hypothetical protein